MVIRVNKKKIVKILLVLIFFVFVVSYIVEELGYYEYTLQNKMVMTNESIAKFEKDLKDGKNVILEDYIVDTHKDYTSTLTKGTIKISTKINSVLKEGIEGVFKVLGSFVEE